MIGPRPRDYWMGHNTPRPHGILVPGRAYKVTQAFTDFDGDEHPFGETWTFLGCNFLPYDDGLSLFVTLDGENEWHFRMHWTSEDQGPIIDNLQDYIADISATDLNQRNR